jgi:hypothetical protein
MLHTVIDRNFGHKTFAFRGDQGYKLYKKLMEIQDAETLEYCATLRSHLSRMLFVLRGVYGFDTEDILIATKKIFDAQIKTEKDRLFIYQTTYNVKTKFYMKYPDNTKYVGFKIDGRKQRKGKRDG